MLAACSSTIAPAPNPPSPPPPSCVPPGCVFLKSSAQHVALPAIAGIKVVIVPIGSGYVSISDSATAPGANVTPRDTDAPRFYAQITALNGAAELTSIPGFDLIFPKTPDTPLRLATLEDGVWTTVGKPAAVHGTRATFAPATIDPPVRLKDGTSYQLEIYSGGIIPTPSPSPSPTPTPSPTSSPTPKPSASPTPTPSPTSSPTPTPQPGTPIVTVICTQSADACTGGNVTTPGNIQFTAIGDTAAMNPMETPMTTFTLKSDTCNKTDDPAAGGNWATINPGPGQTGTSFVVAAKNGGTNANPSSCSAVIVDAHGQSVTINIGITLGTVGIH